VDLTGTNSFEFTGRVGGRALKLGSYALAAVPENSADAHGAALSVAFTIEARPSWLPLAALAGGR
jgi:hypothetical protein